MLLAVGWPARRVKRLLLVEGGLIAALGAAAGVGAGLIYTRLVVHGLATVWRGAVAGTAIQYHVEPLTLLVGAFGGLVVALLAIWFTLRRHVTRPARQLMAGNPEEDSGSSGAVSRGFRGLIVGLVCFAGVVVFLTLVAGGDSRRAAGAFFGAGALLLLGLLGVSQAILRIVGGGWSRPMVSLGGLGFRNATRRSGRSLAIVGLLGCGVFMVVAVGANRRNPLAELHNRDSGTGGFALYGESSVAVLHDMDTESGRESLDLEREEFREMSVVQFRVNEGDDASCFNLNRAQRPRLLGVDPRSLRTREAFRFTETANNTEATGWDLLDIDLDEGAVPAVGDYPTVFWALGKNIGDEVEYTDESGRAFRVRIVGMLASSVLQGSLVIEENEFVSRYPSIDGYNAFLIDAPVKKAPEIASGLSSGLQDYGIVLTPTAERLAAFSMVENTYLSIFMMLGGLGLALGSVGLGLVVLRNLLERRGEFAMLRAIGYGKSRLRRLVFYEHWGMMLAGLMCGLLAAVIAVLPAARSPGGEIPYLPLAVTVVAIATSGAVWVWLAATLALRGPLLQAIRDE
jgi:hypothetical protein